MQVGLTEPSEQSLRDAPRLSLKTLGGAGLRGIGEADLLLGPGKPLALLIFIALTPGRRISREFLVDLLWADRDERRLLDVQWATAHLTSLGVIEVARSRYLARLRRALDLELPAPWV